MAGNSNIWIPDRAGEGATRRGERDARPGESDWGAETDCVEGFGSVVHGETGVENGCFCFMDFYSKFVLKF